MSGPALAIEVATHRCGQSTCMLTRGPMLLCLLVGACSSSGDYESECALSCSLPDGGVLRSQTTIACCGVHENPTHSGEEGSACTPDWVSTRTQQFCSAPPPSPWYWNAGPSAGTVTYDCPANAFQCSCVAPHTYPSFEGCD
jgi:hypothetical protein